MPTIMAKCFSLSLETITERSLVRALAVNRESGVIVETNLSLEQTDLLLRYACREAPIDFASAKYQLEAFGCFIFDDQGCGTFVVDDLVRFGFDRDELEENVRKSQQS